MPETSSRMSASSSTTRMSAAMGCLLRCRRGRRTRGREYQSHQGARQVAGVAQRQFAPMVFENAFDDGQAQARALFAGGDIGLGQPVAVARRQAHAIVLDAK